jgi:hypothetical protein
MASFARRGPDVLRLDRRAAGGSGLRREKCDNPALIGRWRAAGAGIDFILSHLNDLDTVFTLDDNEASRPDRPDAASVLR